MNKIITSLALCITLFSCSTKTQEFDASKYDRLIEKEITEAKEFASSKSFTSKQFELYASFIDSIQTATYENMPDSLQSYAKPKITFAFASDIVRFPFSCILNEWLEKPPVPENFDNYLPKKPFNDTTLLAYPEFKAYINDYLDMKAKYSIELEKEPRYKDLLFSNVLMDHAVQDIENETIRNISIMNLMIKNFNEFGIADHKPLLARFDSLCTDDYAKEKIHAIYDNGMDAYPNKKVVSYKKIDGYTLNSYIFEPNKSDTKHPAIVFIFGGGWYEGKPEQFFKFCDFFSQNGFVAMAIDYRTKGKQNASQVEGLKDVKSAIRWLRENADTYHVDPDKIIASGWSAGGQLALASAVINNFNETSDDLSVSAKPNMTALLAPGLDNPQSSWFYYCSDKKTEAKTISPIDNIDSPVAPTIFFVGTKDIFTTVDIAKALEAKMKKVNSTCQLNIYEGLTHYDLFTDEVMEKILAFANEEL